MLLSVPVAASEDKTSASKRAASGPGGNNQTGTPATPSPSRSRRLPCRPGIVWRPCERLEAMDFLHKWYPAKIVTVREEDLMVLIHFEGWNQRYDEWVEMKSERLRPMSRHSERKEKKKLMTSRKVGDHVLAKWSDCKMYPAKILSNKLPAGYEVLFYDGFKKLVQPSNIQTLPPDFKKMDPIPNQPAIGGSNTEESLSSMPPSLVQSVSKEAPTQAKQPKKNKTTVKETPAIDSKLSGVVRERRASSASSTSSSGTVSVDSTEKLKEKKRDSSMAESSKKEGKKKEKSNVFPNKRRQRLIVAGAFLAKRDIKKKSPPVSTSKQSLTKFKAPTGKSKLLAEKEPNLASIHHHPTAAVQENVPKKRVKLSEKEKGEKGSTDSEHSQKAKSEGSSKRRHSQFYAYPSLDSTSTLDSPGHFSHEDSCSADLMEEESEAPPSGKRHNKRSKNNSFSGEYQLIFSSATIQTFFKLQITPPAA
ncbi:PHF20 [Acanthosepion pharaonis]|uniref:PHF20 n=1 Tax=Acanthosepion pharaonis TaxID=158019 RepID=A0A812CS05_ACAPH|nr:PHF20 [Sepia pharaonis]